jgi:hypothetical protein
MELISYHRTFFKMCMETAGVIILAKFDLQQTIEIFSRNKKVVLKCHSFFFVDFNDERRRQK